MDIIYLTVVLICIFLINNEIGHLFIIMCVLYLNKIVLF